MKTKEDYWKEEFLKVTSHWYKKETPNMPIDEFIAVKERRASEYASQSLSSKIAEVREKFSEDFVKGNYKDTTNGLMCLRDDIFTSLEGERGL